ATPPAQTSRPRPPAGELGGVEPGRGRPEAPPGRGRAARVLRWPEGVAGLSWDPGARVAHRDRQRGECQPARGAGSAEGPGQVLGSRARQPHARPSERVVQRPLGRSVDCGESAPGGGALSGAAGSYTQSENLTRAPARVEALAEWVRVAPVGSQAC